MGYDAYARHIMGIKVTQDQFFTFSTESRFVCEDGHVYEAPVPKFCPICGKAVREEWEETPTPKLLTWFGKTLDDLDAQDSDGLWEDLKQSGMNGFCVHDADPKTIGEGDPDTLVFGHLLGYSSTEGGGGETGFTISELQAHADEITAEAAKLGITGEVKLYLQLYESI